ncbi:hypothetical protein CXB51_001645 [Gossypium anomalum]|uniref:Dirigent protein n=1 Tax=Gossypium anomalum TaxID=47600 RepID=A0A8J6D9T1_9ROSI|nr:hypothetical protein CXB51_001645 [Gossypium anomalum]
MIARPNIMQASSFVLGNLFAIDDLLYVELQPISIFIEMLKGSMNHSVDTLLSLHQLYIVRELAIVGGRGAFRRTSRLALTQLNFVNMTTDDVVLECNVTLYHY